MGLVGWSAKPKEYYETLIPVPQVSQNTNIYHYVNRNLGFKLLCYFDNQYSYSLLEGARWQYFLLFEVGMKYVWPGTYRRPSSSSPASNTQPYQGAGLHKFEATVGKVKKKMLPNPPFMGIKMTVY